MTLVRRRILSRLLSSLFCCVFLFGASAAAQTIAVQGDHFVVDYGDGQGPRPKFLTFVSYFDAVRAARIAKQPGHRLEDDLDYIKNVLKFDGIRILPNWLQMGHDVSECHPADDTVIDFNGNLRGSIDDPSTPLGGLIKVLDAARARKLIVDVSMTRDTVRQGPNDGTPRITTANYAIGMAKLMRELREYRHVLVDLQNERDHPALFMSKEEIKLVRDAIKANSDPNLGDPHRILVASNTGASGTIPPNGTTVSFVQFVPLDATAYHDERGYNNPGYPDWHTNTGVVVTELRTAGKPVYLQEPTRWNARSVSCGRVENAEEGQQSDRQPEHFRTALRNAVSAGAAAWTFHNQQAFNLQDPGSSFKSRIQADGEERALLEGTSGLASEGGSTPWNIRHALSISFGTGGGVGSVTSSPGGISCSTDTGGDCSSEFAHGAAVTLTAAAAEGSRFLGWIDTPSCGTEPACTLTFDGSRVVVADFAIKTTPRIFYYHTDAIGSVRAVTNDTGQTVARYDYLPFGEPAPGFVATSETRQFAGKERDAETSFDYFGGRYLSARAGRFTTVDPVLDLHSAMVDPQRWGRYAYVQNNPLRFIDPDGRQEFDRQRCPHPCTPEMKAAIQQAETKVLTWTLIAGGAVLVGAEVPVIARAALSYFLTNPGAAQKAGEAVLSVAGPPGPSGVLSPLRVAASIDDVVQSALRLHSGGEITEGARAIQKKIGHAASRGFKSAFDGIAHTDENAAILITEILGSPTRIVTLGKYLDVYDAAGRGLRIERETGKFIGFRELRLEP